MFKPGEQSPKPIPKKQDEGASLSPPLLSVLSVCSTNLEERFWTSYDPWQAEESEDELETEETDQGATAVTTPAKKKTMPPGWVEISLDQPAPAESPTVPSFSAETFSALFDVAPFEEKGPENKALRQAMIRKLKKFRRIKLAITENASILVGMRQGMQSGSSHLKDLKVTADSVALEVRDHRHILEERGPILDETTATGGEDIYDEQRRLLTEIGSLNAELGRAKLMLARVSQDYEAQVMTAFRVISEIEKLIYTWQAANPIAENDTGESAIQKAFAYVLHHADSEHLWLTKMSLNENLSPCAPATDSAESSAIHEETKTLWKAITTSMHKPAESSRLSISSENPKNERFRLRIMDYFLRLLATKTGTALIQKIFGTVDPSGRDHRNASRSFTEPQYSVSGTNIEPASEGTNHLGRHAQVLSTKQEPDFSSRHIYIAPSTEGKHTDTAGWNIPAEGPASVQFPPSAFSPKRASENKERILLEYPEAANALAGLVPNSVQLEHSQEAILPYRHYTMGWMPGFIAFGNALFTAIDALHGTHSGIDEYEKCLKEFENPLRTELEMSTRPGEAHEEFLDIIMKSVPEKYRPDSAEFWSSTPHVHQDASPDPDDEWCSIDTKTRETKVGGVEDLFWAERPWRKFKGKK
ncbi:hypothetical protein FUAX_08540 [Fulvitalea axinellae]|uniref:Uncharacterized protein n=1 Tax=Fulvitalea axinellae TaxID=1182444 RepID=A0AAU9CSQ6_9BACT|nr:hypothetical protein FUAX_08540 [Fulvitalea axinellae]